MANAIIILVNKALEKVGEIPIQTTDFDSGLETHMMIARRSVEDILRKMFIIQKDEKLKYEFSLSTVASQAEYSLGFDGSLLADTNFRVITSDKTDYYLIYLDESTALTKYIDFANLDLEGKPVEWWFRTGSTAGSITIRFNPIPDDIYTIKGFKYTANSAVTAISVTPFTELGDNVIVDYVAYMLANQLYNDNNLSLYQQRYNQSMSSYLLENQKTDNLMNLSLPHQATNEHRGNSSGSRSRDYFEWGF